MLNRGRIVEVHSGDQRKDIRELLATESCQDSCYLSSNKRQIIQNLSSMQPQIIIFLEKKKVTVISGANCNFIASYLSVYQQLLSLNQQKKKNGINVKGCCVKIPLLEKLKVMQTSGRSKLGIIVLPRPRG